MPCFGKVALLDGDLALAARLAAAADGFDFDAQRAGGIQQVRAGGHLALAAGRLKNDAIRWSGMESQSWLIDGATVSQRLTLAFYDTSQAKPNASWSVGFNADASGWSPPTRERATVRAFLISLDMASAKRDKEWRLAPRPIIPTSPPWEASHAVAGPFEPSCCASRLQNASLLSGLAARHRDHGASFSRTSRMFSTPSDSRSRTPSRASSSRSSRASSIPGRCRSSSSLRARAAISPCATGRRGSSRTSGRSGCSSRSSPAPSCSVRSRSISRGGTGWPRA